ncbi:MAG: hypothetical protein Q8M03_12600 [Legionella sp.]|nr:hypothetical protein [Legionella sp.]
MAAAAKTESWCRSERAQADDPSHALLLNGWSATTGRRAALADVGGSVRLPSHMYVVPANAFALVLAGGIAESIVRALLSCTNLGLPRASSAPDHKGIRP